MGRQVVTQGLRIDSLASLEQRFNDLNLTVSSRLSNVPTILIPPSTSTGAGITVLNPKNLESENVTISRLLTVQGSSVLEGNTTLGDASTDTITFNSNSLSIPNNLTFSDGNVTFSSNLTNSASSFLTNASVSSAFEVGNNKFYVSGSNNFIGLNTNIPSTILEVQGTASASYLLTGNTLQVGGYSSVSYNRFGTSTTGHSNYITSSDDVMISGDLETRGTASFGGVASVSGNFFTYGTNTFSGTGSSSFAGSLSVAKGFLAGANNAFVVNGSATANTLNVVGGNVGVGTTAPLAPLHVLGQCVTGDTRLRRRRRKNKKRSNLKSEKRFDLGDGNEDGYFYDEVVIKDIQPGDEVLSLNEQTGKLEYQKVKGLMDMGVKPIFKLTTASGKTIRTTGNHPYLVRIPEDSPRGGRKFDWRNQKAAFGAALGDFTGIVDSGLSTFYQYSSTENKVKSIVDISEFSEAVEMAGVEPARPWLTSRVFYPSIPTAPQSYQEDIGQAKVKPSEGRWTKVISLREGQQIAVADGKQAVWDTITKIETLPSEQVYDIEVENTHNFIGNDIVAHNTYLASGTGNVGIRTTSPSTLFEVQGTASASYLLTGNTLQVGGFSSAAYNRFGTSTTGHSNYITSSDDVMISGDLETRGTASFGGVASVSGNFFTYGTNTFSSTGSSSFAGSLSVAKGFLAGANNAFVVNANATANTLNVVGANVGIGTTAPIAIADIEPADGTAGPLFRVASGSNERLRIQSDGNVGIGTINVDTKFEVAGTASISSNVYLKGLGTVTDDRSVCAIAATGELELVNGACGTSSLRYKENIAGLDYGLAEIAKLNPVFFNYTKDSLASASLSLIDNRTKRRVGFIAEEVNEIIPEVVIWQDGRIENIDYAHLTSILTKGVQELKSLFDALTAKIEPILAWFVNGKFVVQNDICVDEVCVTKEQFKALLNQVQMTNGQMSPKESQSDPTGQANQIQSSNSQIPIPATTTTPLVNESPAPTTASASVSESQIPQNVLSSDGGTPNQTEQSSDGTGQAPQSGEDATAGQATDDGEPTLAVPIPSPSLEPSPTISPENTPEPPPETTPEIQPENE